MRLTCLVNDCVPSSDLWGEHGLSFLIETIEGNVLWDTGRSGTILFHNLRCLDLDQLSLAAAAKPRTQRSHGRPLESVGGMARLAGSRP